MNMNKNCVASSSNVPNVLCSVRQMLLEKRKLRQILKGHSVLLCLLLTEGRFLAESLSFEGLLGKTLLSQVCAAFWQLQNVEEMGKFIESILSVSVSKNRVLCCVGKSQLAEYTGFWYEEQCSLHALFRVLYDEDVVIPGSVEEQVCFICISCDFYMGNESSCNGEDASWRELCQSFTSELDTLISTLE